MAQTKMNKTAARIFTGLHGAIYKLTKGKVGGKMSGGTIIVLETKGRRTGKVRERPLIALDHPDGWTIVASFSGHDEHPGWFHNLQADPNATIRLGSDTHRVKARVTSGAERTELWDKLAAVYADYNEYQAVTEREIPVVVLERQSG